MHNLETPNYSNIVDAIITAAAKDLNQKREAQIIERLKELGYSVDSEGEKIDLFKRMTLVTHHAHPFVKWLYIDDMKLVATWSDEPHFDWDPNDYTFKATIG